MLIKKLTIGVLKYSPPPLPEKTKQQQQQNQNKNKNQKQKQSIKNIILNHFELLKKKKNMQIKYRLFKALFSIKKFLFL